MDRMLPDGLILRTATYDDAEALATFNAEMHGGEQFREWTLDFFTGGHPCADVNHIFVITAGDGTIVSSAMLIPQRWRYGDVEIGVAQVEAVATRPGYRRQGLVRHLMTAVHARAADLGLDVQVISGIRWFYRQFGYAYALDLWVGRRAARSDLALLKVPSSWSVRPAAGADLERIAAIAATDRGLVCCPRDEAGWRYELSGRREDSFTRYAIEVVERAGVVAGVLVRTHRSAELTMGVLCCELAPGTPWLDAGPAILRHCHDQGVASNPAFEGLAAGLGRAHPLYDACPGTLAQPFDWASWYVRVPDLAGLFRPLVPILDRRLHGSVADGWTGELKISCYTEGLRLALDRGRVAAVEPLDDLDDAGILIPRDQLVQLVFGFRDLDTLVVEHYDCWVNHPHARAVLVTCFPHYPSNPWPLC